MTCFHELKYSWKPVKTSLTLCVSQLPGSHSLMSRQLFYLLLCGCWPQLHRRRRCSRRRPLRLSTGASEGDGEEKRLFKCINVSIVLTYLIFVYSTFLHKHSKDNVCKHIISMVWHSKQNLHSTLTQHESRDLFFHYNRAILSCLVLWSGQWSCNVTIIIPNKSPPLFKAFFFMKQSNQEC